MRKWFYLFTLSAFCLAACNSKRSNPKESIAETPVELQKKSAELIKEYLANALENNGKFEDSSLLFQSKLTGLVYEKAAYEPIWCHEEKWLSIGDSMADIISKAKFYGLFPEDYHVKDIENIRSRLSNDSLGRGDRKDAAIWARADILMTDAFMQMVRDIKLGRLPNDSVTLRKDTLLTDSFYLKQLMTVRMETSVSKVLNSLEPKNKGYAALKKSIPAFLEKANYKEFTKVPAPGKNAVDFNKLLQKRLFEEGYISYDSVAADSVTLAEAVKKFQKEKGITVDGRAGEGTVRLLNDSDREKFIRIAISMDKFKLLPEEMPKRFVWVNIPSYYMQLVEGDSVKINSKVIIGKPKTRTPVLTSAIHELITYPQWVPPPSIVLKEILPAVKKNPGYLAKKGFSLLDSKGEEVDPYTVDWSKFSKGIPYRVVQGSGDANALGILKFVFNNKYSVYLHDTNQRSLFGVAMRSLSHGCVRVQEWEKLTYYLLRLDSLSTGRNYSKADSVRTWLVNKQKRSVLLKNKMPVFIRYITCEGRNGEIVFHDDIYGEDKKLKEKYFASK